MYYIVVHIIDETAHIIFQTTVKFQICTIGGATCHFSDLCGSHLFHFQMQTSSAVLKEDAIAAAIEVSTYI